MTTPRERALERLTKIAPHLPNAGTVVNELVAAYEVVEAAKDLGTVETWRESDAVDAALVDTIARFDSTTVTG